MNNDLKTKNHQDKNQNFKVDTDLLLKQFIDLTKMNTQADPTKDQKPTSHRCWKAFEYIQKYLESLGLACQKLEQGYLIAHIPATAQAQNAPCVGFIAHVDTSYEAPCENIDPQIHTHYQGEPIFLKDNVTLSTQSDPDLAHCLGQSIITSDGKTLLGADDKAGVVEILAAITTIIHEKIDHGPLELIFTTDEEVNMGVDQFPKDLVHCRYAYTIDGSAMPELEYICYNAYEVRVEFEGNGIHPGLARGKLINAISMLNHYLAQLPAQQSPEATDGLYGCLWPSHIEGSLEQACLVIHLRYFQQEEMQQRLQMLERIGEATSAVFQAPVTVTHRCQYKNMQEKIEQDFQVVQLARQAFAQNGLRPKEDPIRGGTDGSRLSFMGILTPNIFTGGHNAHSKREWICLSHMETATKVIVSIIQLWSKQLTIN